MIRFFGIDGNPILILVLLVMGHFLADFALQHHQFAMGKSPFNDPPGYDPAKHGSKATVWPYYLTAHAAVHGLTLAVLTGSVALGMVEWAFHLLIDAMKVFKLTTVHQDQALHLFTKVGIVTFILLVGQ